MTVEITDIDPSATCTTIEGQQPGRFVSIDLQASMPLEVDPEFYSPFRGNIWSVSTTNAEIEKVDNFIECQKSDSYLNLMDEFPGYSADGTAFFSVPENAELIHVDTGADAKVKIAIPAPAENYDEPSSIEEPTAEIVREHQPAPAPAAPTPYSPEPVIGITQAPSVETPHVLDKQIASCGEVGLHQTGTTFFTDGTSGWTEQCAAQMM